MIHIPNITLKNANIESDANKTIIPNITDTSATVNNSLLLFLICNIHINFRAPIAINSTPNIIDIAPTV